VNRHGGLLYSNCIDIDPQPDDAEDIVETNFEDFEAVMHVSAGRSKKRCAPVLSCYICLKVFPLACRLAAHLRIHDGQKDFACSICGKKFALAYRLLLHTRTHTGESNGASDVICAGCMKMMTSRHMQLCYFDRSISIYFESGGLSTDAEADIIRYVSFCMRCN